MSWLASFDNLAVNFRNLFRPKNTEALPWKEKRERSARYRASFALVHNEHGEEACIGCKMCEKICPSEIISVTAGGRKESPATGKKRGYCDDFTLDLNACIICELCVQVCPEDAILMLKVQEEPGYNRESLVLTMDKLYENEKLGATTWATGAKLIEMQAPPPPPPKPAPAPAKAAAEPPAAPAKPAPETTAAAPPAPATPSPEPKPEEASAASSTDTKPDVAPPAAPPDDAESAPAADPPKTDGGDT